MATVALDIETHLISQHDPLPRPVCYSLSAGSRSEVYLFTNKRPLLAALRADHLLGFNLAGFDLPCIWQHGDEEIREAIWHLLLDGRGYDGMIGQRLDAHTRGPQDFFYSLKKYCEEKLGILVEKEDTWRLRYAELEQIPVAKWPAEARDYAKKDAWLHLQVCLHQREKGLCGADWGPGKTVRTMPLEMQKSFALKLIEMRGVQVDRARCDATEIAYRKDFEAAADKMRAAGILRTSGSIDTKALHAHASRVEATTGRQFPRTPKSGAPQLVEDLVDRSGDPILIAYKNYKSLQTLVGDGKTTGIFAGLRAGGSYISRHSYDPLKSTGRTGAGSAGKSSDGTPWGGNIQNVKRSGGIRECYIPRPGYYLASADFSALELHTFSQIAIKTVGWSKLAAVLNSGKDAHSVTGAGFCGKSYEEFKNFPEKKKFRSMAKPFNFGTLGGMGEERFIPHAKNNYHVDVSSADFRKYKQILFSLYPEIPAYHKVQGSLPGIEEKRATIKCPITGKIRGGLGFTDATNNPFQTLGAYAATYAAFYVVMHCYRRGGQLEGCFPVAFIHDEILMEIPIGPDAGKKAQIMSKIMAVKGSKYTPQVPLKTEVVLMDRWSKSADPTYDSEGNLVVTKVE